MKSKVVNFAFFLCFSFLVYFLINNPNHLDIATFSLGVFLFAGIGIGFKRWKTIDKNHSSKIIKLSLAVLITGYTLYLYTNMSILSSVTSELISEYVLVDNYLSYKVNKDTISKEIMSVANTQKYIDTFIYSLPLILVPAVLGFFSLGWKRYCYVVSVISIIPLLMFVGVSNKVSTRPLLSYKQPLKIEDCSDIYDKKEWDSEYKWEDKIVFNSKNQSFEKETSLKQTQLDGSMTFRLDNESFIFNCNLENSTREGLWADACAGYTKCLSALKFNNSDTQTEFKTLSRPDALTYAKSL
ncbi:MAG: hypothetical protein GJ671_09555 [Alteromonadaceae bacterium]|nr:hypothetical protein [Alteromonadaceae bacterium]